MSLTVQSIANALFKKLQGKGSTNDARQFFEEPRDGRGAVFLSQVVAQSDLIPTTAPGGADQVVTGVVKRWVDLVLTAVPGVSNSFYSDNLKSCIPFNFGDGSYNYTLKDSTGATIPFGQGDWLVDTDAGTVTFYGTVPGNMPPKISFYQYVGTFGAVGANPPYLQLVPQANDPAAPASGYQRIYLKTDGKAYTIDSTGAVKRLAGSGGGASGKNYLADYYDGTSITGIQQFGQYVQYSFASNLVDQFGDTINYTNCPYATGQAVTYTAGTTAIGGLTSGSVYYVVRIAGQANIFGLATSIDNAQAKRLIDLTSQGAGTHQVASFSAGICSGVGGTPSGITQSINTTLPLRNPSNIRLSKPAANYIGMGWSIPFTMDRADVDIGRPMKVAFKFRSSANFTALSSVEDGKIQLYDVDNQLVVPLDGLYQQVLPVSLVTTGFQFGFQPNLGGYNYRFIITNQNVNTNAYDLDFVDFEISSAAGQVPGSFTTRTVLSDTLRPTVTAGTLSMGANVYNRVFTARQGDMGFMRVEAQWNAGGSNGGNTGVGASYLYNLPAPNGQQWQFDPARVQFNQTVGGTAANWDCKGAIFAGDMNDNQSQALVSVVPWDATRYRLGIRWTGNNTNTNRGLHGPDIFNLANLFLVNFQAQVPILGFDAGPTYSTSEIALKNTPTSVIVPSQAPSTTNAVWSVLSGNAMTVQPGTYDLFGSTFFTNNGTSPAYNAVRHGWFGANGTGTGTPPAALSSLPGVTVFGIDPTSNPYAQHSLPGSTDCFDPCMPVTVKFTQPTTIYYNALIGATTPGNSRIAMVLGANKRPDYSAFGVYGQVDIRSTTSSVVGANGFFLPLTGNQLTLPVGTWKIKVSAQFVDNGSAPTFTDMIYGLYAANGTNTATAPAALSTLTNLVQLTAGPTSWRWSVTANNFYSPDKEIIVRVTTGQATVYVVTQAFASNGANARVSGYLNVEKLQ
jgi:hypothetical protein